MMISFFWIPLPSLGLPEAALTNTLSCPCPTLRSRFDAGSGMATIRHPTPLTLGQFYNVTLLRSLTHGSLIVGNLAPVNGTSQVRPNLSPVSSSQPVPTPIARRDSPTSTGQIPRLGPE